MLRQERSDMRGMINMIKTLYMLTTANAGNLPEAEEEGAYETLSSKAIQNFFQLSTRIAYGSVRT